MSDDIAIRVHDLYKSFELAENKSTSIKQLLVNAGRGHKKYRQKVLDGIDFEVKKGEFFGIVGKNGSGKSTLLKILAGVYAPDSGAVQLNGNLTPFIELGVGFNPELSGKDNVYLSASLLGYPRKIVDKMYDEIVDFSELHEHMDKKLKNYSSGMQVRLAFSIAIKAKNDILIFDEVLAVGDAAFQKKCMEIFDEYRRTKQTVVLVTHSMDSVRDLCTRALMLSDGKIACIGGVKKVSEAYLRSNDEAADRSSATGTEQKSTIVSVAGCKTKYKSNETMNLDIGWPQNIEVKKVGVAIMNNRDECIFGSNTGDMELHENCIKHNVKLSLGPGIYHLTVAIYDELGKPIELISNGWRFTIQDDYSYETTGLMRFEYDYAVTPPDQEADTSLSVTTHVSDSLQE